MNVSIERFYLESEVRVTNSRSSCVHHESDILPESGEDNGCSDSEEGDS